jgi:hypothetical protein
MIVVVVVTSSQIDESDRSGEGQTMAKALELRTHPNAILYSSL